MTFDSLSHLQVVHLSCYAAVFATFGFRSLLWVRRGVVPPAVPTFRFAAGCMVVAALVSIRLGNPLQAVVGGAFAAFYCVRG